MIKVLLFWVALAPACFGVLFLVAFAAERVFRDR